MREPLAQPATPASPTARAGGRILIIRPSALGDVARTVPALVTLRKAHPDARIDWLVNDAFADVIRHHPALDGVVPFPRKRFGAAWRSPSAAGDLRRWIADLRAARYDLTLDLQGLFRSGLIARLTGAPQRIGFANAREMSRVFHNRRFFVDDRLHAVDRTLGLLRAAGYDAHDDMNLHVGADDRAWLDTLIGSTPALRSGYFAVAPTARWLCKCWPIERYIDVTRRLLADGRAGAGVVVLAAPSERDQVAPLLAALGHGTPDARVVAPTTTVGQLMALLSRASVLLANDSAPLHIAVGLNRPVVALFGPTDPALVGPYRRDAFVLRPPGVGRLSLSHYRGRRDDQSLIAQITADAAWERVTAALRQA